MPIFKKDFLFFLKPTALIGMLSAVIVTAFLNIESLRSSYLVNYPSPFHWVLSIYPVWIVFIGLALIARMSASENTHKTNIFLHALPVSAKHAFFSRWLSLWLNLLLYSGCLLLGLLALSYRSISIHPGALLELTLYVFVHVTFLTSICLLFEKFGRFRIIGYTLSIIALRLNMLAIVKKTLSIDKALITANFNLARNGSWEWQIILIYLVLALALSAIAFAIHKANWTGVPRKLSFKEKYTMTTAIMLTILFLATYLTDTSKRELPKKSFEKKDIITETSLLDGTSTLSAVNPGQYTLDDNAQLRLSELMDLLKVEVSDHIKSFGELLECDGVIIKLTAGPLEVGQRKGQMVLSLPIDDLQATTSVVTLKNDLIDKWLMNACDQRLQHFAKLTNRDVIYFGLPKKESSLYQDGFGKANADQLRSLHRYISQAGPENWMNWDDYGTYLPSIVAAWTLHGIEQQVGRDSYLEWIKPYTNQHSKNSYAPFIGDSILFDDIIQAVNYALVKTSILTQLDQAISEVQTKEKTSEK